MHVGAQALAAAVTPNKTLSFQQIKSTAGKNVFSEKEGCIAVFIMATELVHDRHAVCSVSTPCSTPSKRI